MKLTAVDSWQLYLGKCLEGFFYGLYSGIFAIYLCASKKDINRAKNIMFYALSALYVLSMVSMVLDFVDDLDGNLDGIGSSILHLEIIQNTVFGCCDFIAQSILIYRCWIIWGRNISVVIIPSFLAFGFLITWTVGGASPQPTIQDEVVAADILATTGLSLSMTVNALVTGLIVFKILKMFQEAKTILDDQISGVIDGSTLRRIIFIIIESGMALFAVQLTRLVITILPADGAFNAFLFIGSIHQMLNGITPTIILVRVSVGLSFHDENSSLVETTSSLHFASVDPNLIPATGSVDIRDQERGEDDIRAQLSDDTDIQIVER